MTLTRKEVTTRKPRRCVWCGEPIEKGERAVYITGKIDGDFFAVYMHPECHHAMVNGSPEEYSDGYLFGDYHRGTVHLREDGPLPVEDASND